MDFTTEVTCRSAESCQWQEGGSKCGFINPYTVDDYVEVPLNASAIALPADMEIFSKHLLPSENSDVEFQVKGEGDILQDSWLRGGDWMQHFMVWMRSPASPLVRNLWARIEDGLPRGLYVLN